MVEKETSKVEEGEVVARTIRDARGNTLIEAGTEMTDSLKKRLEDRGIFEIEVRSANHVEGDTIPLQHRHERKISKTIQSELADTEIYLNELFQGHIDDQNMIPLYNAAKEYWYRHITTK